MKLKDLNKQLDESMIAKIKEISIKKAFNTIKAKVKKFILQEKEETQEAWKLIEQRIVYGQKLTTTQKKFIIEQHADLVRVILQAAPGSTVLTFISPFLEKIHPSLTLISGNTREKTGHFDYSKARL